MMLLFLFLAVMSSSRSEVVYRSCFLLVFLEFFSSPSFNGVSRNIKRYLKFKGCFKEVSGKFKGVFRKFQGRVKEV